MAAMAETDTHKDFASLTAVVMVFSVVSLCRGYWGMIAAVGFRDLFPLDLTISVSRSLCLMVQA